MAFGRLFKTKSKTDSTVTVGNIFPKQYKPQNLDMNVHVSGDGQNITLRAYDGDNKVWQRSPKIIVSATDPAGNNEIQTVTITGGPAGGTFTLTYGGQTTSGIAYNAIASAVQTALTALSSIGANNATVSGSAGGPYTVTFVGALGHKNVALITASGASLTGGTSPAVGVVEATAGSNLTVAMGIVVNDLWVNSSGAAALKAWTGTDWK